MCYEVQHKFQEQLEQMGLTFASADAEMDNTNWLLHHLGNSKDIWD